MGFTRDVGDKLNDIIDTEVRTIVETAREKAVSLLTANRDALERITKSLIEKEVLEGDELSSLLAEAKAAHQERAAAE